MIEALVISCQEPQLPRCLESVKNQHLPFDNIIHIDNIVPEYKAFNKGIEKLTSDWVMIINGDMILYPTASIIAQGYTWNDRDSCQYKDFKGVSEYQFGLYDPFVMKYINSCSVYRVEPLIEEKRTNSLRNDLWASRNIVRKGWIRRSLFTGPNPIVIGTHFEDADNFQIFRRFYTCAVKKNNYALRVIKKLYEKTKDKKYSLAIQAMEFGFERKEYPGSHNLDFDRKMYEMFNRDRYIE